MHIFYHKEALRRHLTGQRQTVLVPTMGALHAGHLSLVERAKQEGMPVVVSIFVNPTQFGPSEDFDRYPRTEEADLVLLKTAGVEIAYLPSVEEIYPGGQEITVNADPARSAVLCGRSRPGHFDGVVTVVDRLFRHVHPAAAIFGEKDYQQLAVIRAMAAALHPHIRIVGAPTLREPDGLALSSRNRYLSTEERALAPALYQTLLSLQNTPLPGKMENARAQLANKGFQVEYLELGDPALFGTKRLFIAARLGKTRLIDNIEVRG